MRHSQNCIDADGLTAKYNNDSLRDKWVGYKEVFYSFEKDGKEVVKLEQWLDEGTDNEKEPGNTWGDNPVHEDMDEGNWESKIEAIIAKVRLSR
jgi:hypothetical protein